MEYPETDSTSPWQTSFESYQSPITSYLGPDYLSESYLSQPFTSFSPRSHQPFVETVPDTNWPSPQFTDIGLTTSFDSDQGYPPLSAEFPHDMYTYEQPTIHYPYTISDGSSSATTSIPSTPMTHQLSDPWRISGDVRCYEVEDTDLTSTLPLYNSESSSLPYLNKSHPSFAGREFKDGGDTATVNPQYLHPKPLLPSIESSPQIRPISPATCPSPSPPLPSPLMSPRPQRSQPPTSFQDTLKTELLRRHRADQSITRLRTGTLQSRAQADEDSRQLDWAKDMLLRFPRESAQIPPARAPSPEAWNILKGQTQMTGGLFK